MRRRIHELSLLMQQLQSMDGTHGTKLIELEARLIQTDLQLDEAIGMASDAKNQGVRANIWLNNLDEDHLVLNSDILSINTSVSFNSSVVKSFHTTATVAAAKTACFSASFSIAKESLRRYGPLAKMVPLNLQPERVSTLLIWD